MDYYSVTIFAYKVLCCGRWAVSVCRDDGDFNSVEGFYPPTGSQFVNRPPIHSTGHRELNSTERDIYPKLSNCD